MDGPVTLLLARVDVHPSADISSIVHARPYTAYPGHLLLVNKHGQLFEVVPGTTEAHPAVLGKFELLLASAGSEQPPPAHRAWNCFMCHEDGILFVHSGSCNMLFAQLPAILGECCSTFLFGKHAVEVTCMVSNNSCLVSGAADGSIKLWEASSGQQLDEHKAPVAIRVTALTFIGPLMVAVGNQEGVVTLMDLSERRLTPVHRFMVESGPVSCLSVAIGFQTQRELSAASAPRAPDGGGVVQGSVGLPWRNMPYNLDAVDTGARDVLLAVGSRSGWLHIYQPTQAGEYAWQRQYSGSVMGSSHVEFSAEGRYLLTVAGGELGSSVMVLSPSDWTVAYQWHVPQMLVAAGFLAPGAELAVFRDSLRPAVRLTMYGCPRDGLPSTMQCKLPLLERGEAATETDTLRTGLQALGGLATAVGAGLGADLPGSFRQVHPMPRPILSPVRAPKSPPAGLHAPLTGSARGGAAESSLPGALSTTMAALRAALKPSTLPVGRSWLTDTTPPPVDLSDVAPLLEPPQPRQSTPTPSATQPLPQDVPEPWEPQQLSRHRAAPVHTSSHIRGSVTVTGTVEDARARSGGPAGFTVGAATDTGTMMASRAMSPGHEDGILQWQDGVQPVTAPGQGMRNTAPRQALQPAAMPSQHPALAECDDGDEQPRPLPSHVTQYASPMQQQTWGVPAADVHAPSDEQDGDSPGAVQPATDSSHIQPSVVQEAGQSADEGAPVPWQEATLAHGWGADRSDSVHSSPARTTRSDSPTRSLPPRPGTAGSVVLSTGRAPHTLAHSPAGSPTQDAVADHSEVVQQSTTGIGTVMPDATADADVGEYHVPDFVSTIPPQDTAEPTPDRNTVSPARPAGKHTAIGSTDLPATAGGQSPGSASAANLRAGPGVRRRLGMRGPATDRTAHRMTVTMTQPPGAEGAPVGAGSVSGSAPPSPAPLPRSPYRGYKPNMAVLLKELRSRNQAGRKAQAAVAAVRNTTAAAPRPVGAAAGDRAAPVYPQPQQIAQMTAAEQHHHQQSAPGSPPRWPVGPTSVANSMMLASPTSQAVTERRAGAGAPGEVSSSTLQQPQLNSTMALMGRIETLTQQVANLPTPPLDPTQQAEVVAKAAALTANIPPHVRLYPNLQPIGAPPPPIQPSKQLHPKWLASRAARPEIGSLWSAQEQQKEVCSTRGLGQYVRPKPEMVAVLAVEDVLKWC